MHRVDTDGHVGNLFDEGDPGVPRLPTVIDSEIMNALQEEIAGTVEAAGITLVKNTNTQLKAAVVKTGKTVETMTGKLVITEPSSGSVANPLLALNAYDPAGSKAATIQGSPATGGVLEVTNNGAAGAAVKATHATTGPAVDATAGTGASIAVKATAGTGAGAAVNAATANNANIAAVHASTGHTTQAVFAEKTAGDGASEAAAYAKSTGYALIAETTGTVRAPLRIVGLAAAPSSAQNGDVYYDTATNKLRIYAAGAWADLH